VVVIVRSRLGAIGPQYEQAARDLGASPRQALQHVLLPLLTPAILASMLIVFALSIDDFVVTQFNSGAQITFPLYIYGASRNGVPVQVNVIGSLIFLIGVGGMFLTLVIQNRRAKRDALASAGQLRRAQAAEAN
jgi:spermidine/putrescine transport system permease protein